MRRTATAVLALAIVGLTARATIAQVQLQYNVVVTGNVVKGSPQDHYLTFNEPVQIPDAILPAGTYIFSLVGSSVVQVSTSDRSQQLAMFLTRPVARPDTSPAYEVKLLRPSVDARGRITQWFLPYQTDGFAFLYSTEEVRGER